MSAPLCATESCSSAPRIRIFWPGRDPQGMCDPCAARAQDIASGMGFRLHTEPLAGAAPVAAHTPGPWLPFNSYADTVGEDGGPDQVRDASGAVVAYLPCRSYGHPANALLIAAGPDMLEALRGVVRVADRDTAEFAAARAAIAKATGGET